MKRFFILLTVGCFLSLTSTHGAQTAHARLYCMSLQFQQGTTSGGIMNLSTTGGSAYNGELLPTFANDAYGNPWGSGLGLVWSGMADSGTLYVNLPSAVDANNDGFNDFFEVSQGVAGKVTSGSYSTSVYFSGTVTATWTRAAGSASGTCVFYLYDDLWEGLGNFTCPFTLIEYTGPLTYTPGSNTVSAVVNLAQTGSATKILQGPINFIKSNADRFNTLTNQPGLWTNAASQTLGFDSEIFMRGGATWRTNYAGYVNFSDGNPATAGADYQLWVLSIDDTNDVNANGIPDFSDNPASVTPPHASRLSLLLGSTNLWLTISGDLNHTNQIQQNSSLISTNWQTTQSFLLTNTSQSVSLPLPNGSPKYWRVVAW